MKRAIILLALFIQNLAACSVFPTPLPEPSQTPTKTKVPVIHTRVPTKTPNSTERALQTSEAHIFQEHGFLAGEPCMAPCFLGITPGETPIEKVTDSFLGQYLYQPSCTKPPNGSIICNDLISRDTFLYSDADPSSGLVEIIEIYPYFPLYLKDVIKFYGEPDHVYFWAFFDEVIAKQVMLYYDKYQARMALPEISEGNYYVTATSVVEVILFFDEDEYLDDKLLAQHSWKGYGEYKP